MNPDRDVVLSEFVRLSQENLEAMLELAIICYADGNLDQVERVLSCLIALSPNDARLIKLLASTLWLAGKLPDAERMYLKANEIDPENPYVLVALGELMLEDLRIEEAFPYFDKLFTLDPDGTHPAANRGRELVQQCYAAMTAVVHNAATCEHIPGSNGFCRRVCQVNELGSRTWIRP